MKYQQRVVRTSGQKSCMQQYIALAVLLRGSADEDGRRDARCHLKQLLILVRLISVSVCNCDISDIMYNV